MTARPTIKAGLQLKVRLSLKESKMTQITFLNSRLPARWRAGTPAATRP